MREIFVVVWPYMLVAMTFTLIGYLCGWRDCLRDMPRHETLPDDRAVCSERSRGPLGLD